MTQTYTRQSSLADGDTITAALFNDEYNQLVNAFAYSTTSSSTGHQHDGTAAEGGNIHTIGDLDFLNKIVADSTNNRWGVFVEVSSAAVEQIRIQDGAIVPVTDNDIDLGTSSLEFKDAYFDGTVTTDGLTVSSTTNLDGAVQVDNTITVGVDDTGYDVKFFGDTASAYMLWDTSTDDLVLAGAAGIDLAGDLDVDGTTNLDNTDIDGTLTVDGATISLDATTSFNIDTSNTSNGITIGTGTSGVPVTIGHTTSETTVADNLTVTGNVSIGGNFDVTGTIDFSDSAITNAGSIQLDSIAGDGDTNTSITFSGSDVITVANAGTNQVTFNDGSIAPVTDSDVDLGTGSLYFKNAYIDTVTTTGAITSSSTMQGTTITATTAFVPDASDGAALGTSSLEFSDLFLADGAVINFGDDQDVSLTHVADTGLLLSSTDQLQFGDSGTYIYQSADGVLDLVSDTEIELTATTIDINGAVAMDGAITGGTNITISGELDAATLDISGNADIDGTLEADAITVDGTTLAEYIADTAGAMFSSNTESGITVTYQDGDNTVDLSVDAAQTGITSIYATDLIIGEDSQTAIDFGTANEIDFKADNAARLTLTSSALYPVTDNEIDLGTSSLEFKDAYFDGTVTADAFAGPLTGDVTGNVSGTAATVTTAAQSNITSLGTLTTLTVDNVIINGSTIGHTGDTDLITVASGIATVAGEVSMTTLDIGGTNVTATAAELNILDGVTSTTAELNILDGVTATAAEINVLDASLKENNSIWIGSDPTSTTDTASNSVAVGVTALDAITTGDNNVAIGYAALGANTTASNNVAVGYAALATQTSTGQSNTAVGYNAATANTTGDNLVAVGNQALDANTTGSANVAVGRNALGANTTASNNTALGQEALTANTTGASNVAVGAYVLDANTTASNVTGVGYGALGANTTGANNVAIGSAALDANTTGDNNVGVGTNALSANTTAEANTAVGVNALLVNTTGAYNVAVGMSSLDANTTANRNTAVGYNALTENSTGSENVAVGYHSLDANTTGAANVAIGDQALEANTTASSNVAVGKGALLVNSTGGNNVAIGRGSLDANTTASNNTAVGHDALSANTTGGSNVSVGTYSLQANTTASNNTAMGYAALTLNSTGANNTAIGYGALDANTTAADNTAMGFAALSANSTGAQNTALGRNAGLSVTTGSNNLLLGYDAGQSGSPGGAISTGSNEIVLGDENITEAHIQVDWTVASDARDKTDIEDLNVGLEFVNQLQPKTYRWDQRSLYGDERDILPDGTYKKDQLDVGFLAQDVSSLEEQLGFGKADKKNLISSLSEDGQMYGLRYNKFVPMLVNAIQELSAEIEKLKKEKN